MRWVQHCTAWDAEYPDCFLGLCIQRERWEADSYWEKSFWCEIICPRSKSKYEETAERERAGEREGSLAEISCCPGWDLSCPCHSLTSPTFIGARAREERRSYERPGLLCESVRHVRVVRQLSNLWNPLNLWTCFMKKLGAGSGAEREKRNMWF